MKHVPLGVSNKWIRPLLASAKQVVTVACAAPTWRPRPFKAVLLPLAAACRLDIINRASSVACIAAF